VVLSVHKSQGITVKKDNAFEKLTVDIPTEQTRTTPGLKLVIGNISSDLSHVMIMKIGTAASYAKRRFFLEQHTANGNTNTTKNKGFNCTIVHIVNI
jgi:hypothetical protein